MMTLLKKSITVVSLAAVFYFGGTIHAQHCAPIVESYLSEISVKHAGESIEFKIEYSKSGGQSKSSYQAYVLAYLEKNEEQIPSPLSQDLIDERLVAILDTQLIKRNKQGRYPMMVKLSRDKLAKKMITHGRLTNRDRTSNGGWGEYHDNIRIAVFIPFLEDKKYSTLEGLPKDKHECNYPGDRALLFQQLPFSFSIHFGIVQAVRMANGKAHIQINGDRPAKTKKTSSQNQRDPYP